MPTTRRNAKASDSGKAQEEGVDQEEDRHAPEGEESVQTVEEMVQMLAGQVDKAFAAKAMAGLPDLTVENRPTHIH